MKIGGKLKIDTRLIMAIVVVLSLLAVFVVLMLIMPSPEAPYQPPVTPPAPPVEPVYNEVEYGVCMAFTTKDDSYCDSDELEPDEKENCRLFLGLYKAISERDTETLSSFDSNLGINTERVLTAMDQTDTSVCNESNLCLAIVTADISYCDKMIENMSRGPSERLRNQALEQCYGIVYEINALARNDVSYCERIGAEFERSMCTAFVLGDPSACETIKT